MENPASKRVRPSIGMDQLTPADRQAFERVAALLNKPVTTLLNEDITEPGASVFEGMEIQHDLGTQNSRHVYNQPSASYQWPETTRSEYADQIQTDLSFGLRAETPNSHVQMSHENLMATYGSFASYGHDQADVWHPTNPDSDPWTGTQHHSSTLTDFRDEAYGTDSTLSFHSVGLPSNHSLFAGTVGGQDIMEPPVPTNNVLEHFPSSDDSDLVFESDSSDGVLLDPSSGSRSRHASAGSADSGWLQINMNQPEYFSDLVSKANSQVVSQPQAKLLKWMANDSTSSPPRKPPRRGPFQDKHLKEETSETRRRKACVRCRMQKKRCSINTNDPDGVCLTCEAVSKQKIHTMPCLRYMITECALYRTGKAPGLEFTFRWPVMKLRDISEWADTEIRTISLKSDVCLVPFDVSVRRFVPLPQDSLHKGWMDGKEKKFKAVTPFALVNMSATVKDMRTYINKYVFKCMVFHLQGRDMLIQETYEFARKYMLTAPDEERTLLSNFFHLWFAIRRTATTEHIVGEDTIDMKPETQDPSYPLFGKVPVPPVMIQQLDMVLTLGVLQPLRKKVLEDLHKMVVANKPKSWMTIYLVTFMFLHSCATLSAENYQNARKHGLKRSYAIPIFISELHYASNVFLSHYHYCTKPCNPFKLDWKRRQVTPFAEMLTDEIHFINKTSQMFKERGDKIRFMNQINLYEDDLYFVSQMFDEDWSPRDTVIEYHDGTVADVPLRRLYGV